MSPVRQAYNPSSAEGLALMSPENPVDEPSEEAKSALNIREPEGLVR